MGITFAEYNIDSRHAVLKEVFTEAATSQWQMFAEPMSAFTTQATHSATGTFACTLQGTIDGSTAFDLQALTGTSGVQFVTGKLCRGIRHTVGSAASSGTVTFITVSKDTV